MWANSRESPSRADAGTILLEVIIALVLFLTAAAVVFSGLSASYTALKRANLSASAADLAVTKLSEIQMGLVDLTSSGPNSYEEEELAGWSWQVVAEPAQSDVLFEPRQVRLEIVIAHEDPAYACRLVHLVFPDSQEELSEQSIEIGSGSDRADRLTAGGRSGRKPAGTGRRLRGGAGRTGRRPQRRQP